MNSYRLEELDPLGMAERLRRCPMLVLPFGTIEWHSHHLPLGLDGLVAQTLADAVAQRTGAILAPVSYWAVGGVPYPYTLNLPLAVVEPLLITVFEQFAAMGFGVVVALTGHFGLEQTLALKQAAVVAMRSSAVTILPLTPYDLVTDAGYTGDHAGIGETSLLWATHPELVHLDAVAADVPLDGILGRDPRGTASAEWGQALHERIVERTAEVSQRLLNDTSAEQRSVFVEALAAAVDVLAHTAEQRKVRPKAEVPPLATMAYLDHCRALYAGDYAAARDCARRKLTDLSA